jgi:putative inorganic carbon (HCO3(-)) transporter
MLSLEASTSAIKRRLGTWSQLEVTYEVREVIAAVFVGLVLGGVLIFARRLPSEWAGLIILATIAPSVVLLVNDLQKLLLVILVVDIPLGLDIALANRPGHTGGPGGFMVSLMSMVLVIGYTRWLANRPASPGIKLSVHGGITVPALVYFFTMLVSAFQAIDVWFSVTQLFLEAQFLLLYFYLINYVKTQAHVRLILTAQAACVLGESILMSLQYFFDFELGSLGVTTKAGGSNIASASARVGGTVGGPNHAATYLAVSLVIIFAAYLTNGRLINKKLALIALFSGAGALIMTQSRSGWVAFAVAMLIVVAWAVRERIGIRAVLLFFVVVVAVGVGFSKQIVDRFTTDDNGSAEGRIKYSTLAFNVIADHMFTGIGLNNQQFVVEDDDYTPLEMIGHKRTSIHNKYLAVWVETGLLGLLALVWLLLAAGRQAFRASMRAKDSRISMALIGLSAAMVVYTMHMFTATFTSRMRLQLLWFILGLIVAISRVAEKKKDMEIVQPRSQQEANGLQPSVGIMCSEKARQ